MDLREYRETSRERARIKNLMEIVPKGRLTVLDIGSRDGHISRLLTSYFKVVTALDLEKPDFNIPGIITVKGDVTNLNFSDDSFDTVFCSEVLEHIPPELLQQACCEIARVAKYDAVFGVPYNQDIRVGRTTCVHCSQYNPPWGHVNSFDEQKLKDLFKMLRHVSTSYVGKARQKTNSVSVYLMDLAGNPWGTYGQEEKCIYCGEKIMYAPSRNIIQKLLSGVAMYLTSAQLKFVSYSPEWMHVVFMKRMFN